MKVLELLDDVLAAASGADVLPRKNRLHGAPASMAGECVEFDVMRPVMRRVVRFGLRLGLWRVRVYNLCCSRTESLEDSLRKKVAVEVGSEKVPCHTHSPAPCVNVNNTTSLR